MGSKGKQTNKSRYPSIYAPDTFVTIHQHILELICSRQAAFQKRQLGVYFWKNKEWANIYKRWLRIVHKLSKEYSAEAILHALEDKRAKYKWSLNTDFMQNLIKEHQKLIEQKKEKMAGESPIKIAEGDTFRENGMVNKNLERLMNLD